MARVSLLAPGPSLALTLARPYLDSISPPGLVQNTWGVVPDRYIARARHTLCYYCPLGSQCSFVLLHTSSGGNHPAVYLEATAPMLPTPRIVTAT
jgi:hypothetical protein